MSLGMSVLIAGSMSAQGPVPVGEEFQVNTYTTSDQRFPAVAVEPDGDFVVVWWSRGSSGTDSSWTSIQGQRYDSDGFPVGGEFQVNTYTTNGQTAHCVAVDQHGDFVVVWQSNSASSSGTDTSSYSTQGQRYDSDGLPVGGEFQINTYTTNFQGQPSVSIDQDGRFVVVWLSEGSSGTDTDVMSIQGQRYDSNGLPLGGEFQVNTYTTADQKWPAVAVEPDGDFVVVWTSEGSFETDTDSYSIQGQRYDSDGSPLGGEFQVNTYTTSDQHDTSVAVDQDGDFVVVWRSRGSLGTDTDGSSIQGQRYDSDGFPVGGEFQVNTYTTSFQSQPSVSSDQDGGFVVVWRNLGRSGTDTDGVSIQGQRYDSDGLPVGGEFQVNTYTTSYQYEPAVAAGPNGGFVVVWASDGSYGTDTDYFSVQGQRYTLPVFLDGFESGDTSAWSNTVQ